MDLGLYRRIVLQYGACCFRMADYVQLNVNPVDLTRLRQHLLPESQEHFILTLYQWHPRGTTIRCCEFIKAVALSMINTSTVAAPQEMQPPKAVHHVSSRRCRMGTQDLVIGVGIAPLPTLVNFDLANFSSGLICRNYIWPA